MDNNEIEDLLKRTTFNDLVPEYCNVDGYLLGGKYDKVKDEIDNLEVYDSDIWVTSYPKCGTTWTQEMVWLIQNDFDYEGAKSSINFRFPFLERQTIFNWDILNNKFASESIKYVKTLEEKPRYIKSHLPWELLPKAIQTKQKRPKIIHVMRNPKDACVSHYHHHTFIHEFKGTFEEFSKLFLNDKVMFAPYWKVIESYWNQRNEPNVLLIKYEDMQRDLKSVVIKVAEFLGKTIPDDKIDELLEHLSFKSMQKNPATNYKSADSDADQNKQFIRKGVVGDYANHMTPELIDQFDQWIEHNNKIGLTF